MMRDAMPATGRVQADRPASCRGPPGASRFTALLGRAAALGSATVDLTSIRLKRSDRRRLQELSTAPSPPRLRVRASIVLDAADGRSDAQIARAHQISPSTAKLWRCRFTEGGIEALSDKPRPGRPSALAARGRASEPVVKNPRSTARRPAGNAAPRPIIDGRTNLATAAEDQRAQSLDGDTVDPTLEVLLQAASTTISRRGYASTRVADIAAEAGVSPAAVHYYFHTRDEILVRALLWANEQPLRRIEESTASGNATHRLAAFLAGSIPTTRRSRDEYRIEIDLWSHARHEPALLGAWESYNERWTACLRDILTDGVTDKSFQPVAAVEDIAERIVSMADGLAAQYVIGAKRMPLTRLRDLLTKFTAQQVGVTIEDLAHADLVPSR